MSSSHIDWIEIRNFKSLNHIKVEQCSQINVFIGKPNVGKSSILEALSLLGNHAGERFFSDIIHYELLTNLFYDQEIHTRTIQVSTSLGFCALRYFSLENEIRYFLTQNSAKIRRVSDTRNNQQTTVNGFEKGFDSKVPFAFHTLVNTQGGAFSRWESPIAVRRYEYRRLRTHSNTFSRYLLPPDGENLVSVLQTRADIRSIVSPLFDQYGIELVMDVSERLLKIQKRKDGLAYSLPYSLVADTLQRMILYIAAIASNSKAILLFEEPEAHAFPPYVKMLADMIAADENNQYFITTHSPYFLQTLAQYQQSKVTVFVVDVEHHQTIVKRVEGKALQRLIDSGSSVFFNLERLWA